MSYQELLQHYTLKDYIDHGDGSFSEIYDGGTCTYECIWYPANTTNIPNTICTHKNA